MLRTIKTIARLNSVDESELRRFLIKNIFNIIPFREDFLVNPWTAKEIVTKFRAYNKTKK